MAVKSSPRQPARQPRPSQPSRVRPPRNNARFAHEIGGIALIALALVLLVSLVRYDHAGIFGMGLATLIRSAVGVGSYLVPILLTAVGVMLIWGKEQHTRANFSGAAALLFVIFVAWWSLAHTSRASEFRNPQLFGGWVGAGVSAGLRALVGDISSHIILFALTLVAILWATDMRLLHLFQHAANGGRVLAAPVRGGVRAAGRGARLLRQGASGMAKKRRQQADEDDDTDPRAFAFSPPPEMDDDDDPPTVPSLGLKLPQPLPTMNGKHDMPIVPFNAPKPTPLRPADGVPPRPQLIIPELLANDGTKHSFVLPPLTLLNESPPKPVRMEKATQENQAILMRTLNDFKIGANVAQVAIGPTVTRYEVQLEPGILVKKIVSLADNLAMALAAIDVRVEAPIPGKSAIGIEVPNEVTQMVSLRECISTTEFMNAPSKLTFALGKDVSGQYRYADLARMPHLLVGGSTNSGKSVCLNAIISSMVYRATPREVKFVMIDPKRVELSLYDGIPHLLAPVVKNVKQAAGILRSVLKEMEERYDRFARLGTRNLDGYNSKVQPDERLPFIVVVIDELADLMMQQGPEVETSICRLAQLARATGIHLVIATQRPSVDVITGTIKANISSRIAFAVATQVDSRTIIDMPGADRLIGRGDMLFLPIDAAKPLRIQGCFVGERETETMVKYLREQEEPVYTMIPSEAGDGAGSYTFEEDDGSSDELFEPCVRWLVLQGQCSTSSLQRKFKIGYTRAARLVEVMEARGIVGSQDGVKPREILLRSENVEAFFAGSGQGDLGQ